LGEQRSRDYFRPSMQPLKKTSATGLHHHRLYFLRMLVVRLIRAKTTGAHARTAIPILFFEWTSLSAATHLSDNEKETIL
jgi:hypothetical protein